jgi:dolichyl-diphosphooligosaccharide--protein glycosyltransferase
MSDKQKINDTSTAPRLVIPALLALFFGISLFFRAYLPYEQVFSGDWIRFTSVDAYFHMRLVDNLVQNFPLVTNFDPYLLYPFGTVIDNIHFYDWLLAGISWLIGLGSPDQHTVDVVGVFFPAVLAALTVIPVYFIGKALFGRGAGVVSAALIAIMPGEFLGRSILGFTDHHVAEVLFTTTAMMFLILAIKASRERELTLTHIRNGDWNALRSPVIRSLLAGLFLGLYLITWIGALFFVFIITACFLVQFIIEHLRRNSTDYLVPVGVIVFLVATVIFLVFSRNALDTLSLAIALVAPVALYFISRTMQQRGMRPLYYPLALVGLGGVAIVLLYVITPPTIAGVLERFSIFTWSGSRTILEMQPILAPRGDFTLQLAWGNFTTGFFLSVGLLGSGQRTPDGQTMMARAIPRQMSAEVNILLIWSVVMLLATMGQRRFAYYFAVNVALLTGFLSWELLKYAGFRRRPAASGSTAGKTRPGNRKRGFHLGYQHMNMALGVVIVFFVIGQANNIASRPQFAPDIAWLESLAWLEKNTPEPFADSDAYFERFDRPPPGERFQYPDSAYAVMSWVDYGYWIARVAHRPVTLTPGPGGFYVATTFLSQDENSTEETEWRNRWEEEIIPEKEIMERLGAEYVMIDHTVTTGKYWALANWAERELSDFMDTYFIPEENQLRPVQVFYPEYFRSLVVRMYNFDGQAVNTTEPIVISYEDTTTLEGVTVKVITGGESFSSYQEALAYIEGQESGNYRLVSNNPFVSPVPLEELQHYKLIYSSAASIAQPSVGSIPSVKIFEYIE